MGGATAPLSSSSSESALGRFSDLATAWFSMGPFPSPAASSGLPVISSTAASTALTQINTLATRFQHPAGFLSSRWRTALPKVLHSTIQLEQACGKPVPQVETGVPRGRLDHWFGLRPWTLLDYSTYFIEKSESYSLSGSMHLLKVSMSSST